jgi:hypothetical protein
MKFSAEEELNVLEELAHDEHFHSIFGSKATAWGVSVLPDPKRSADVKIIPVAMAPKLFSRALYEKVMNLTPIFNKLVNNMLDDVEWVIESHRGMCHTRDFSLLV